MKILNRLFCLYIFFVFSTIGFTVAQDSFKISGMIYSAEEELAGVEIVNNSKLLSYSNELGEFNFLLEPGEYTLSFRLLGFFEKRIDLNVSQDTDLGIIKLELNPEALNEIVVTGQFSPQSLRNSVYQVRVINQEQIKLRGASNLQSVLNTELGMRFSQDLTLGTGDIELMGMSGQNVKILLDGIPLIDRGSTRESLNQIDINTVEKIEIVEGPMSVNYGSDALAGVINIITKNAYNKNTFSAGIKIQEETAGKEYSPFNGVGLHQESVSVSWQNKNWQILTGASRNFFGGWQGENTDRKMKWIPKEQYLGHLQAGYRNKKLNLWYRINGLDETLKALGNTYINLNTNNLAATDQFFVTHRIFHQLQGEYDFGKSNSLSLALSNTNYSRQTQTTEIDLEENRRTRLLSGNQDKSIFKSTFLRLTGQNKINPNFALQQGVEVNLNSSIGERIEGSPQINDFAYFISAELTPLTAVSLRPGVRFIKNSVYEAPPVIPSLNTKFSLIEGLELRAAYARGFRSPALRELYFTFFDASHSIIGNKNLKAEESDSFNAFISYRLKDSKNIRFSSTLGGFYNSFSHLITIGIDPADPNINTYLNVLKYKTTGTTLNNILYVNNFHTTVGLSRIGRFNNLSENENLPKFLWTTEVNALIRYTFLKANSSLSLYYKYTGKLPRFVAVTNPDGIVEAQRAETQEYSMADLTFSKIFYNKITLNLGVKNLFNITDLLNTQVVDSGDAHSTGGNIPMSYGRSYFAGLIIQINK